MVIEIKRVVAYSGWKLEHKGKGTSRHGDNVPRLHWADGHTIVFHLRYVQLSKKGEQDSVGPQVESLVLEYQISA